jgi:hypothetical protein
MNSSNPILIVKCDWCHRYAPVGAIKKYRCPTCRKELRERRRILRWWAWSRRVDIFVWVLFDKLITPLAIFLIWLLFLPRDILDFLLRILVWLILALVNLGELTVKLCKYLLGKRS